MKTKLLCLALVILTLSATLRASDPSYYVKKSTWFETMRASREALLKLRGNDPQLAARMLGGWYAIGPFKATGSTAFTEAFSPESEIALDRSYAGGTLQWHVEPGWSDRTVIDLGDSVNCATYLYRTITVPNDTLIPVSLGSDDGIKVWLNGREIFAHNVNRACRPDQEEVDLSLKAGENRFLMKINNNQGAFAYYFRLVDAGVDTIWALLDRDFPGGKIAREMKWEKEDSIWVNDWTPGDLQELARRYVNASLFDTPKDLEVARVEAKEVQTERDLNKIRQAYLRTHEPSSSRRSRPRARASTDPRSSASARGIRSCSRSQQRVRDRSSSRQRDCRRDWRWTKQQGGSPGASQSAGCTPSRWRSKTRSGLPREISRSLSVSRSR